MVSEYVFGFAGRDATSSCVFYTADKKLAYYIAAIGVVLDPVANKQAFFTVGGLPCAKAKRTLLLGCI